MEEAGDCTPLEQAQFELAVAQAKVRAIKDNRKIKENSQIKEKREQANRATASASLAGPPASKRRYGESSEEGGGPEAAEAAELGEPSEHATQQKLKKMSIAELREALREDGKDSTGKKSELVERLLSARTAGH